MASSNDKGVKLKSVSLLHEDPGDQANAASKQTGLQTSEDGGNMQGDEQSQADNSRVQVARKSGKVKTSVTENSSPGRPGRKAAQTESQAAPKSPDRNAPAPKRKRATANEKGEKIRKKTKATDPSQPKVDGRKKNKGAPKRESYSVAFKARMMRDFDAWEAEQIEKGNQTPSVREFVSNRNLGHKFENFLSKSSGWRSPKLRERILQDSATSDYQHMARMPDRSKNKSYYAEMEDALLVRLEECRAKNLTVTTRTIRELAREELRRLTDNDEEKVNAFKASNGWVYNFLKRQGRKAKEDTMQQKRDKASQKKLAKEKEGLEEEEGTGMSQVGNDLNDLDACKMGESGCQTEQEGEDQAKLGQIPPDGAVMEKDDGVLF